MGFILFLSIILQLLCPITVFGAEDSRQDQQCHYCQIVVETFVAGLDKTQRENYGGGNTRWEESRLGSWAGSETRLLHIMEKLCEDVTDSSKSSVKLSSTTSAKSKCHTFVEEQEEALEHWWFQKWVPSLKSDPKPLPQTLNELFSHLCVNKLNACCPSGRFGPNCQSCSGVVENQDIVCSGHGKCNGNATRSGNGQCVCDTGYKGKLCDECNVGYFSNLQNSKDCYPCHVSCAKNEGCYGPGPMGCKLCSAGWHRSIPDSDNHPDPTPCLDVNECLQESNPCASKYNTFCENTPGSYECKPCHASCASEQGCSGSGPGHCRSCSSPGYEWNADKKECQDVNECAIHDDVCTVKGQICRNTAGSFACECPPGEEEDHNEGRCVKKKIPEPTTQSKQQKKTGNANARRRVRIIWTTEFAIEFLKVVGVCIVFSVFVRVLNTSDWWDSLSPLCAISSIFTSSIRIFITVVASFCLVVHLYNMSSRLDKAYLRS